MCIRDRCRPTGGHHFRLATQRRTATVATKDADAGPSKETTEMTNQGRSSDTTGRDKGVIESKPKAGTSTHSQGGKSTSTVLSKAQINVIRTMILIVSCFVICLFPIEFYFLYNRLMVFIYQLVYRLFT